MPSCAPCWRLPSVPTPSRHTCLLSRHWWRGTWQTGRLQVCGAGCCRSMHAHAAHERCGASRFWCWCCGRHMCQLYSLQCVAVHSSNPLRNMSRDAGAEGVKAWPCTKMLTFNFILQVRVSSPAGQCATSTVGQALLDSPGTVRCHGVAPGIHWDTPGSQNNSGTQYAAGP